MTLWFLLAVLSALFGGLFVFMQKIAAMRNYNTNVLNSYSAAVSASIGLVIAGTIEGFGEFSLLMVGFAMASGIFFIVGTNLRMDALRHIDSTIFFPLHKFIGPLITVIIGITFFSEVLTSWEWLGISAGLLTPLLLISKAENIRQKQLTKGLVLTFVSASLAALSISVTKEGTNIFSSVLLFSAVAQLCSAIFGLGASQVSKRFESIPKISKTAPVAYALGMGVLQYLSFVTVILAFAYGGLLSVVYTINSLYILIPIVLSILLYKEHWNVQKAVAIVLSLLALILMM